MNEDYENDNKMDLKVWRKIFKIVFKDKKLLVFLLISIIITVFAEIVYPLINSKAIELFFDKDSTYEKFPLFIGLYIGLSILIGISTFCFLKSASKVENETSYDLRKQAYEKLQILPYSYYDKTATGWIMARMTSDSRKLSNIISWGLVDMLWAILTMIFITIVLLIYNPLLSLIVIILVPVMLIISLKLRKKILKEYREVRKVNSLMTASYNDSFMGSKTTKTLVIEDSNYKEFNNLATRFKKSAMRAVFFSAMFGPILFLLTYTGVGATIVVGGNMVLGKIGMKITVDQLYLFISYTIKFFDPISSLTRILADFQQAQVSAERVVSLIDTVPEMQDSKEVEEKYGTILNPKEDNYEKLNGDIEFRNVSFKYNRGQQVLTDFNLNIKKGESVAFVGHTGSGKSTIVNLICRFYEPTKGQILIDNEDYKQRSISWLHSNIGYVLQSPQLFKGTIKDNIRYGKLDATMDEIIKASKIANCYDFIMELDDKFDFDVGEGGNRLSIGQKQLISFARAIVRDPQILVLDEATSSVDTETEYLIQDALKNVIKGRTSLVVAHRLSTIINSDKIIVLKDGKILEIGNHQALLNKKGYYYELYKTQFVKELEESSIK